MTLNLNKPNTGPELKPRIVVVGVGGAGCNAVNNMIDLDLDGVEFIATNTDAQSLAQNRADRRIQLGTNITHGLGSGARPDIGRAAAEEAMDLVIDQLQGGHMAFVTAGMGGGTGTGAAPVIARAAREMGILTVGVVTKPFHFEGSARMEKAEQGLLELQQYVDTLIIIPNQNLFRICNENTTFADAFRLADNVLYSGVRGVTDLMVMPGLINLDFADIRTVMSEMGKAMMGTGEASGDNRAIDAAEAAIANPLLDDVSMKGAKGVLINITGGADMTLFEVDEAANRIRDEVDPKANIIFGSTFDEGLEDVMRVSIVATGIDVEAVAAPRPASVSILSPAERRQPHIAASPADQPSAHPMRAAAGHDIAATAVASASTGGAGYGSRSRDNHIPPVGPSATPATMRDNASQPFIAPRPVEPALGGVAQTPAGDPFTTRIVRPSAPEPRRKKGLNIFQRVSERVAGLHEEPVSQEALIADEAPVSAADPAADAGYPEPTLTQGEPPETKAAVAEPQLETDPTAPALEPGDELVPEPAAADAETEGNKAPDDPEQQSLKYVETGGPAGPGGSEEDLLEIPAFLRRQAN